MILSKDSKAIGSVVVDTLISVASFVLCGLYMLCITVSFQVFISLWKRELVPLLLVTLMY